MAPLQCPQTSSPSPPRTDCVCFSSARSLDSSGRVDPIKLGNTKINVLGSADGGNSLAMAVPHSRGSQQLLCSSPWTHLPHAMDRGAPAPWC